MANVVIMPKQGQSVESCIITNWHKAVGDDVKAGDLLFSYETDKAAFDHESDVAGILLAIIAQEGDVVPCLDNVCVIGEEGEDVSAYLNSPDETRMEAPEPKPERQITIQEIQRKPSGEVFVSPRARKAAENQGVDARKAMATGPNGRIIERDIYKLAGQDTAVSDKTVIKQKISKNDDASKPIGVSNMDYTDEKLSNVRKVIAKVMHESLSSMAQLTNNSSFDATDLLEYRKRLKAAAEDIKEDITINDMILFAVSRALKKNIKLNAHFLGDKIRIFNSVNLGIAVDTDRGLLVPTLYDADKKTLGEISKESKALISSARAGKIDPSFLTNGTFTVTNLGALGVESFTPVINPPQVAILGICAIQTRIREVGKKLVSYPAMVLSLTYDHRAVDGAPAARFAKELGSILENYHMLMAV